MKSKFPHGRVVLITGASSGIGAEAARLFAQNGYTVYGASRRGTLPEEAMPGGALHALCMDVASGDSVRAGVEAILAAEGRLDILIHAAGNGLSGPIECSTAEDAAQQMDINYFGALRLLNAALPGMRERGCGLVLLIGSVGGEFSIPFQTLYSSSKAALAMLCDGLRMELVPFGVHAALVEPGDVKTGFTAARRGVAENCPTEYQEPMRRAITRMERDEQGGMPPEMVARALLKLANTKKPRPHKIVGGLYALFVFCKRLLPYALIEKLLYRMYCK